MPPPVDYPDSPRGRRALVILGLVLALFLGGGAAGIVLAQRDGAPATSDTLSPDSAKAAIQDYLDALAQGKDERIAEHASCGMFDSFKDTQSDMVLANLASDAFRRQFSTATVTTIDKIVTLSENQSQVLFTMRAKKAGRNGMEVDAQATAGLLVQGETILVCNYLPRTAGPI